jgi:DNA invertase Pin-like site-specific DNA recombinase
MQRGGRTDGHPNQANKEDSVGTALVYIRQSRTRTDKRTISLEIQEEICRKLPAVQSSDQIEVYVDRNRSGKSVKKRTGYQGLYDRIEAERVPGEVKVAAVYDQSRLGRNKLDAYKFYALLEERPWIEVVFGDGSTFDRTPSGGLTFAIKAAVAEYELQEIKRKVTDAYRY